ncbi:hypothetical protein GCM10010191_86820 [Actinomadura vinacea]|uniref:SnoaL-like domain-containing protein n=1 Tax=Actinomadura vinacea TaxID=115336 RepID=A0ABP5XIL8_9ACTN
MSMDALKDRLDITDTLYRYGSSIDAGDLGGLRAILADDLHARYGNGAPITGADAAVSWIADSTRDALWQHHFLSVYHVDIHGDRASALVYHTSHKALRSAPGTVNVLVGRYRNELVRLDGWKISELLMEVCRAD